MSTLPLPPITPLLTAQLLGITTSLFLSGTYFASPALFIPLLLPQPSKLSTSLFADLFHRGALFIAPLSLVSTLSFGTAAFLCPTGGLKDVDVDVLRQRVCGVAALCAIAPLGYTYVVMKGGIDRLVAMAGEKGTKEEGNGRDEEVKVLLQRWARQTYVRAALSGAGGLVGLWGLVL